MLHNMETRKTDEGGYDKNDRDIGLIGWWQIEIITAAQYEDIIIIKKWNIKRSIYKFDAEKIGSIYKRNNIQIL